MIHRLSGRILWGRMSRFAVAAAAALTLSACAMFDDTSSSAVVDDTPVDVLYQRAESFMRDENFKQAAEAYDEVERLYPTSTYAKRSILKSAAASYRNGDYSKASLTAGRFLDFYPSDANAPRAQYLIAMSEYDQIQDVGRDQGRTKKALQALRELVNRYPGSEFAREAQLKLDLTLDHLAGKEMEVGRYYLKRANYIGAINRFRAVIEQFQTTSHVPEALHRLVESYLALGVTSEAQNAAAVLGHNFPGSDWYLDSFALLTGRDLRPQRDEGSWLSKVWRRVGKGEWL